MSDTAEAPCAPADPTALRLDPATPWGVDRVAQAIVALHPDGLPLETIGGLLGISRQRTEQVLAAALAKLRAELERDGYGVEDLAVFAKRRRR